MPIRLSPVDYERIDTDPVDNMNGLLRHISKYLAVKHLWEAGEAMASP